MSTPARATATPVRSTRKARAKPPGALPALTTKQSSAYGSQGKVSLHTQVATNSTDFAQVFESVTSQVATNGSHADQGLRNRIRTASQIPRTASPEPDDDDELNFKSASLEDANSYEDQDEMLDEDVFNPDERARSRSPTFVDGFAKYAGSTQQSDEGLQNEPNSFRIFLRTLPRYIPRLIADISIIDILSLLGFLTIVTTFVAFVPLPEKVAPARDRFFDGIRYSIGIPSHDSFLPPWDPTFRMDAVESKISLLQKQYGLHEGSIAELRKVLPDGIALRKINGEWYIPTDFWRALTEKMSSNQLGPLWDRFLAVNSEKIASLLHQSEGSDDAGAPRSSHAYVSRDEFLNTLATTSRSLEETYKELLRQGEESILKEARKLSKHTRTDARREISELGYKALLINTDRALHEVNYFSVGLGAVIDPKLTSLTFRPRRQSWIQIAWAFLAGYEPHPPVEALRSWDEATDCWCSEPLPSNGAKAQIAIKLASRIYPEILIVEHVPPTGTRTISAAPKNIEIWVEMASFTDAMHMKKRIQASVPLRDDYKCGNPPSANYVCLGMGTYDIEFQNHVQTFPMFVSARDIGLRTDKLVIKVTDNWGADWTCLYRIRMTGRDA